MALIVLSGSWTLIFLVLLMWTVFLAIPIALIVWQVKKVKRR
jgi:hypothetical protein